MCRRHLWWPSGGILVSSILAGRLLSRTGNLKPFVIVGSGLLTAGFAGLGTIDHRTSLVFMSAAMLCIGLGVGMTMRNFVLVVQNSVPLKDIGTANTTVTFFRSLGGTFGVTVLGAYWLGRSPNGPRRVGNPPVSPTATRPGSSSSSAPQWRPLASSRPSC
ncbi:MFS transporter [Streptomyces sp. NPDC020845]|uniref:MFS transporter n=1 Tax=Streptomyces sp. NPDC020845 TaxID=3365096 RepID=UPI00379BC5F0